MRHPKKEYPRKRATPPKAKPTSKISAADLLAKHVATLEKHFGCVEEVDRIELDRYCRLIVKIEQLRTEIEGQETIFQGHGYKPNPLLSVIKEYEYQAAMIANRLGLHLTSRQAALSKVKRNAKVDPKSDDVTGEDDLEAELSKGGNSDIPSPV